MLIKHSDDWSGPVDVTAEFSKSVKTQGADFEDILASDTPAIWKSNRPAKGGATGAMLNEIIEKAAALKGGGKKEEIKKTAKKKAAPAKPRKKTAKERR